MGYTITAQVYQTNPNAYFHVAGQGTLSNDGSWAEVKGAHVLTVNSTGVCGSLLFRSNTNENTNENTENFFVTLGVDNNKPWGDIVTNLPPDQTCNDITPQYYSDKRRDREQQREKHLATYSVDNVSGRKFAFNYTVANGKDLKVNIIIG